MTHLLTICGWQVWLYAPRYWRTCFTERPRFSRRLVAVGPVEIFHWSVI